MMVRDALPRGEGRSEYVDWAMGVFSLQKRCRFLPAETSDCCCAGGYYYNPAAAAALAERDSCSYHYLLQ